MDSVDRFFDQLAEAPAELPGYAEDLEESSEATRDDFDEALARLIVASASND
jgi:hypothetical protein